MEMRVLWFLHGECDRWGLGGSLDMRACLQRWNVQRKGVSGLIREGHNWELKRE